MTPLAAHLKEQIARHGPMPVSALMAAALTHPQHGYYRTAQPLGRGGDFITAPEVSQIFGELIGAWVVTVWDLMGRPAPFQLVELGPGRGTLMKDALRVATRDPEFIAATQVVLVEVSDVLIKEQRQPLADAPVPVSHIPTIEGLENTATIVLGNEFLDCLPTEQAAFEGGHWHRRCVSLTADDALAFTTGDVLDPPLPKGLSPQEGDIFEFSPARMNFAHQLAGTFDGVPAAGLFIDYGPRRPGLGDTLQAVKDHAPTDILTTLGAADLTSHVDFAALHAGLTSDGIDAFGPAPQGGFLHALGLMQRTEALCRANPDRAEDIVAGAQRLSARDQMGTLFSVLGWSKGMDAPLPGYWEAE